MTTNRKRPAGVYVRHSVRRDRRRAKALEAFQDAAEGHALAALQALAELAQGAGSESARVSAANAVLDRAYGKPAPGVRRPLGDEADGEDGVLEIQWLGKS